MMTRKPKSPLGKNPVDGPPSSKLPDAEDHKALIAKLEAELGNIHPGSLAFGASLVGYYKTRGALTDKQWAWVKRLLAAAQKGGVALASVPLPTHPVAASDAAPILYPGITHLFTEAQKHLPVPRVILNVPPLGQVQLKRAGSKSARPGAIYVTEGGYGTVYYGHIDLQSVWTPAALSDLPPEEQRERDKVLHEALALLNTNPEKAAEKYGSQD